MPRASSAERFPTAQSQYLPSFLFGLVILILIFRPGGLFTRGTGPVERV